MISSSTSDDSVRSQDAFLSPPPSPEPSPELPVIPTDELGMIADDESHQKNVPAPTEAAVGKRRAGGKRRQITYISRHFAADDRKEQIKEYAQPHTISNAGKRSSVREGKESKLASPPVTPARPKPRIYYGVNIDEFSSDSDLTDVPDDIGPDPFQPDSSTPPQFELRAVTVKIKKTRRPTKSPYFPQPHKQRPTFLSTLPFPPLSHPSFGLMQERLAHDPFRLLIATIFLNKTPGERAMPIFYQLMSRYPTPSDLANAQVSEITSIIYGLGFQNQRARKCVAMAQVWIETPPERGKRRKKPNYPIRGDGKDVGNDEVIDDDDGRVAWEISHLPGLGPYSHDSWRMFCRDELRGVAKNWDGEGVSDRDTFEPEWKRVVPLDKELRAYLTWMWLKEGWVWNKETGKRTKASHELMVTASGGGIVVEEKDSDHLIVKGLEGEDVADLKDQKRVERTAGDYLPEAGNVSVSAE